MTFSNINELNIFLSSLYYLGEGSQGVCYLDIRSNIVYKIFNSFFYNEISNYTKEDILKFSNIDNNTFIWPQDIIFLNNIIIGYTMIYKPAKNLYEVNPLSINLNNFEVALERVSSDIKIITNNNIAIYDLMYNVMYNSSGIYIIDTLEYGNRKVTYDRNKSLFDYEIKLFLVDNYFNHFVEEDKLLKEMYKQSSSEEFLREFRKKLSEYIGVEINTLSTAKKIVKRVDNPQYIRCIRQ